MAAAKAPASWQPELQKTWSAAAGGCVTSIALSSKGKVAVSTKNSVLLFDPPPSFALKKQISGGTAGITATSFTTKGNDVVSGGADGFLKWWHVDTGDEVCCTQFPQSEGSSGLAVQEVACSPSGFVAATSGRLLCVFGAGGEHLHTLGADSGTAQLQQLSWLGDNEVLACSGEEVTVWHVSQEQYKELRTYAATNKALIRHIATSPNGRFIAAACDNGVVQVWDTQDEESMDPLLNISDHFDAEVMELAWDANSRLLAAAAGSDVLVWDVLDIHDGKIESYVCIGFNQGAQVTCLAFHPSGKLLASAANNGQCLVHDMTAFDSNGIVDGLVNNVAAASVSESEKSPDPVQALVWHGTSLLLVGTEQGHVLSLQINKQQPQQAQVQPAQPQAAQAQVQEPAQPQQAQAQQQPAQPQAAQSQQQQLPQPERSNSSTAPKYKGQDVRRQHANGPDASGSNGPSHWVRNNRQQGWGGEPLANSSSAPDGQLEGAPSREGSLPSGKNRGGRNREARMQGGAYQGSYRPRDGPVPPVPAGAADSPVAVQEGATAVVPTPWGMVPAVPAGMPPMWMPRPGMMPGMAMPYPIAYQQMIPTAMGPMPPHMAAAQGMTYVPAPAAMQPAVAAVAAGRYSPAASGVPSAGGGGNSSSRAGTASRASPAAGGTGGGGRNGRADRNNQQQQQPQHSSYSPPMANGPAGSAPPTAPHTPNAAVMGANAAAAAAAAAAVAGPPDGRRGHGLPVPGPVPPPGPAPPSAYEHRGGLVPGGGHPMAAVPPPGSRGSQGMYGPGPGGPDGPIPAGMMPHQTRFAGPGGWTPHTPMGGGDRGGYSESPLQQQQQAVGPQHQRGGSGDMGGSSAGHGPGAVPQPHYVDSRAGADAPGRGLPPPHVDGGQGPSGSSRSGSFSGRGGGGMPRGGAGFNGGYSGPAGPVSGGAGMYERQASGSSREGRSSRRAAEREAAGLGGPPPGQGQGPYQVGGSYPGPNAGPEGPPQQHMPGQQLHAQLPRPSGGSGSSQGHPPQQQQLSMQQQQQQQQYVSRHPGPSSTSTGPHAPAGQEQQLRTVGSYGGPPRHAANGGSSGSGGHGHPQGPPPVAAGGPAADSGSAAATPRSPAAAAAPAMAPAAMPGGAVMMAPRPMALHPAGFWMYPTPGAAAQWPAMAYPQHWAPYAAAYGYYPFQPHPAMAAVPSPAAAVPVAAGPAPAAPAAAGTSGSSGGGGGGGGRSSRSGRGDSGLAANAGADGGGYSAAGQQGGTSSGGGGRMSGGGYDSSGMDPQQQHMMRGMPPQQPPQQYMQLQQQGSGGPGGYAPVGSPVAGGPSGPDAYTGPNRTLYVGNLAASVDEQALQQQFGSYGPIANIQVMRDRDTKAPRGFAFVTYVDAADAEAGMALHGATPPGPFQGRPLRVSASARPR